MNSNWMFATLARRAERRAGRVLTSSEREALQRSITQHGPELVSDVVERMSPDRFLVWLQSCGG